MSGSNASEEGLESARRMYDVQLQELREIDDKAMRTSRTAVIVMGFIIAGGTSLGPSGISSFTFPTLSMAGIGFLTLFLSTVAGIGTYTVTEIPLEASPLRLYAADSDPVDKWRHETTVQLDSRIEDLEKEIANNSKYLQVAQMALLIGSTELLLAAGIGVAKQVYGVSPGLTTLLIVVALLVFLAGARLLQSRLQDRL